MLALVAACSGNDSSAHAVFDPCAALVVHAATETDVQRDGVADALGLWRARGVTAFDGEPAAEAALAGASPVMAIEFADAAPTFHGVYDPEGARVLINRDLTDRAQLAVVVAHELGHVFGL